MSAPAEARITERIYYDEPATLEFTAEVTAIREMARVNGSQVWQIALDKTAFYPTSGGQPCDTGVLIATARSGASLEVPITDVEEDSEGEVWHTTGKPLQEGTPVRGIVDADRRRDHMQQHSGQHLLSTILFRDLHAGTVSFHLGAQHSTIDLACGPVSEEDLARTEQVVNEAIRRALPVSIRYLSRDDAEGMLAAGLLRKLPPRSGRIRLIEMPGLDLNACGGTHVSNTAEIGSLLLRGTERVRDNLRLSFICGNRALAAARSDFQQLQHIAARLSTGPAELAGKVARLQAGNHAAAKERTLLLQALAEAEAMQLATAGEQASTSTIIHTLNPQQAVRDAAYGKLLALASVAGTSAKIALIAVPQNDLCAVVLAAKPGTLDCGSVLRAALAEFGGRGGGSREMAQGSVPQRQTGEFLDKIRIRLAG